MKILLALQLQETNPPSRQPSLLAANKQAIWSCRTTRQRLSTNYVAGYSLQKWSLERPRIIYVYDVEIFLSLRITRYAECLFPKGCLVLLGLQQVQQRGGHIILKHHIISHPINVTTNSKIRVSWSFWKKQLVLTGKIVLVVSWIPRHAKFLMCPVILARSATWNCIDT